MLSSFHGPKMLHYWLPKQDVPSGETVVWALWWVSWGLLPAFRLGLKSAQQEGIHVCYCIPGQRSMVGGVTGLSEKSTAVILLNEHEAYVKLPKHLVWRPCINDVSALVKQDYFCNRRQLMLRLRIGQSVGLTIWFSGLKEKKKVGIVI